MNKENIIIYTGLICLVLSILGQTIFDWSLSVCSLLAGVFLFSLFKIKPESSSEKKKREEQERQERIKSLGR